MEHSASRSPPGSWLAIWTRTGGEEGRGFPPPVALSLQTRSELWTGTIGARRAWTVSNDLGVVDALEVDRGDAEVGVTELALDDDDRHALARHLDGVRVAQLVWREASPHAGLVGYDGAAPSGRRRPPRAVRAWRR